MKRLFDFVDNGQQSESKRRRTQEPSNLAMEVDGDRFNLADNEQKPSSLTTTKLSPCGSSDQRVFDQPNPTRRTNRNVFNFGSLFDAVAQISEVTHCPNPPTPPASPLASPSEMETVNMDDIASSSHFTSPPSGNNVVSSSSYAEQEHPRSLFSECYEPPFIDKSRSPSP